MKRDYETKHTELSLKEVKCNFQFEIKLKNKKKPKHF